MLTLDPMTNTKTIEENDTESTIATLMPWETGGTATLVEAMAGYDDDDDDDDFFDSNDDDDSEDTFDEFDDFDEDEDEDDDSEADDDDL